MDDHSHHGYIGRMQDYLRRLRRIEGQARGLAADAIGLARATLRTIKGNLAWALAYNVAALPLNFGGWSA